MGPVYVAFDGDKDKWAYAYMKGWSTNSRVDFDFVDAHDLDGMTGLAQNEAYIKGRLEQRMADSDAFILLVGESTRHLYKYVRWEIELAFKHGLPIIVANLSEKNGHDAELCPPLLRTACAIHVPYKKDAIKYALVNWPTAWRRLDAQEKAKGPRVYNPPMWT